MMPAHTPESPRVFMTGGTRNFGRDLAAHLRAHTVSLSSGYDITKAAVRTQVANKSLDYDIFLNYVHSGDFSQTELLYETYALWKSQNKSGLIVNFGSYSTYSPRELWRPFSVCKAALRVASHQCTKELENEAYAFRVLHLTPGLLQSEKSLTTHRGMVGLETADVADLILHNYTLPARVLIPEIILTSRQWPLAE